MVLPPGMLLLSVEEILFKAKPKGLKATIANINMHNVNLEWSNIPLDIGTTYQLNNIIVVVNVWK